MASIIDGVYEIIDEALDVAGIGKRSPHYRNKTSCINVCKRANLKFNCATMLNSIFSKMNNNLKDHKNKSSDSEELWRFNDEKGNPEKQREYIDSPEKPAGPETKLEKEIIRAVDDLWVNQVPTSSGLVGGKSDGKRNIDLVHRNSTGNNEFTFYELKVEVNYPLYAAMEIVIYGVLYCLARQNTKLKFPKGGTLLKAQTVHLRVVAPRAYYDGFSVRGLKNISHQINIGLSQWLESNASLGITMDFGFEHFYKGFSGREESGIDYASLMYKLQSATP